MPKAKSALKQARSGQRKHLRNQSAQNKIRSGLRRFEQLASENSEGVRDHARQVVSWLDRAAKSRVIHVNAARRYKARIMAQLKTLINKSAIKAS